MTKVYDSSAPFSWVPPHVDDLGLVTFSQTLGVSLGALQAFGCVVCKHHLHVIFRDVDGATAGVQRRSMDGAKKCVVGSKMSGWAGPSIDALRDRCQSTGALHICEGASDAMAAWGSGLAAVGRASRGAGGDVIGAMVRKHLAGVDVRVVADAGDPAADERGARAVAQTIADHIGRDVEVVRAQGGKDVRAAVASGPDLQWEVLGAVVPQSCRYDIPAALPAIPLADMREYTASAINSIDPRTPGVRILGACTGSGKTFGMVRKIAADDLRWVISAPTHALLGDIALPLLGLGVDVGQYPVLDEHSCARFDVIRPLISAGVPAGSAICPKCEHCESCPYRRAREEALQHRVLAVAHHRLIVQDDVLDGRDALWIDETGWQGLDLQLTLADAARCLEVLQAMAGVDRRLVDAAHACKALLTAMTNGAAPDARCGSWMGDVYHAWCDAGRPALPDNGAMGSLHSIMVDRIPIRLVDGALVGRISRDWADFPPAVILTDATVDRDDIAALGVTADDLTPPFSLVPIHPAVQIPLEINRQTSVKRVADIIRRIAADVQGRDPRPLYVIGLHCHMEALRGDRADLLQGVDVTLHHYRSGAATGSNDACGGDYSAVVVLGLDRSSPRDLRRRYPDLPPNPSRGKCVWSAPGGVDVVFPGYIGRAWQEAERLTAGARLVQAMGRARVGLPEGVPLWVVTAYPTGLELGALPELREEAGSAAELANKMGVSVRHARRITSDKSVDTTHAMKYPDIADKPLYIYRTMSVLSGYFDMRYVSLLEGAEMGISAKDVAGALATTERTARRHLSAMVQAGCARSQGAGRAIKYFPAIVDASAGVVDLPMAVGDDVGWDAAPPADFWDTCPPDDLGLCDAGDDIPDDVLELLRTDGCHDAAGDSDDDAVEIEIVIVHNPGRRLPLGPPPAVGWLCTAAGS